VYRLVATRTIDEPIVEEAAARAVAAAAGGGGDEDGDGGGGGEADDAANDNGVGTGDAAVDEGVVLRLLDRHP
jgi:hypothetical protein